MLRIINDGDEIYDGFLICSRDFADWLLKMNETLSFPAKSYYKLVRLFCRMQYKEFLLEEEKKANDFYYRLVQDNNNLKLESTYELVFMPYEESIRRFKPKTLKCGVEFGYRILQTRGFMPGDYYSELPRNNRSMDYIIEEFAGRSKAVRNLKVINGELTDVYKMSEFQRAEERGFIDNQMPYAMGPSCPDRLMCYSTHFNVLSHLMEDVDCLNLVDKNAENYEIRLVAIVSEMLNMKLGDDMSFDTEELLSSANDRYNGYITAQKREQKSDFSDVCEMIKNGYRLRTKSIIDYSSYDECFDYDWEDVDTAPIGLTADDYKRFSGSSDD